jgi:hypothetical protein
LKELIILELVYGDLKTGSEFYEKQDPGCGHYFNSTAVAAMSTLSQFHGIHPKRFGLSCMHIPKFPFGIFYRETDSEVHVIAVLDLRRRPSSLKRQLRDR